jgi:acyl-CoA thioester hydrolase
VPAPFVTKLRVRYAECDVQGVAFNSRYLEYVDVAITELWRAAFGSYQAMLDRGADVVVGEANLRFHQPARFDDELTIEVVVMYLGTTSIATKHRICHHGELLVECQMRHVMVDRQTLEKMALPDWFRDGLAPWLTDQAPVAGER